MLDAPQPAAVDIRFAGPVRELIRLTSGRSAVDVRVTEIDDSLTSYPLRLSQVQVLEGGDNIRVDAILHDSVRLVFDRVAERVVPVAVRAAGAPPAGLVLAGPLKPLPPTVRLRGAASRIFAAGLDSIVLPPVDLASLAGTDTLTVAIDTTDLGILSVLPVSVDVVVPLRLAAPDTTPARREIAASSRRR